MKNGWRNLISSATAHNKSVCELYFNDKFVLLLSFENDIIKVEFDEVNTIKVYELEELLDALNECKKRLIHERNMIS